MIEHLKNFITQARAQGMTDDLIRTQLKAINTPDTTIAALLPMFTPVAEFSAPAPREPGRAVSAAELATIAAEMANVETSRLRIAEGRHVVEIESVENNRGHFGPKFFVNYRVIDTDNRNVVVGGTYTFSRHLLEANDRYGRHRKEIREWVALLAEHKLGVSRLKWDPALMEWARGDDQPCRGVRMIAKVEIVKTKAGYEFAKYEWSLA